MQKPLLLILFLAVMVIVGMVLLFYGSQILAENVVSKSFNVISGGSFEVEAELDPSVSESGIYVVMTTNFKENTINAKILDPFGDQIISKTVESESFEDRFKITTVGSYTLIIENSGNEETFVVGGIGNFPDEDKLSFSQNVTFSGMYLLIAAMVGMLVLGIVTVLKRKKSS